jgi:hypothetical protein
MSVLQAAEGSGCCGKPAAHYFVDPTGTKVFLYPRCAEHSGNLGYTRLVEIPFEDLPVYEVMLG